MHIQDEKHLTINLMRFAELLRWRVEYLDWEQKKAVIVDRVLVSALRQATYAVRIY